MGEEKRFEFNDYEFEEINGKWLLKIDDSFYEVEYPSPIGLFDLLNEQQTEIIELRRAIDYLKTVIRYTIPNQMVADVFKYIGEDYE